MDDERELLTHRIDNEEFETLMCSTVLDNLHFLLCNFNRPLVHPGIVRYILTHENSGRGAIDAIAKWAKRAHERCKEYEKIQDLTDEEKEALQLLKARVNFLAEVLYGIFLEGEDRPDCIYFSTDGGNFKNCYHPDNVDVQTCFGSKCPGYKEEQ